MGAWLKVSVALTGVGVVFWVVWCAVTLWQFIGGDAYESGPRTAVIALSIPLTALPTLGVLAPNGERNASTIVGRSLEVGLRLGAVLLAVFVLIVTVGGYLWSTLPLLWVHWVVAGSITGLVPYVVLIEACARRIRNGAEPPWARAARMLAPLVWLVAPFWMLASGEMRGWGRWVVVAPAVLFGLLALPFPWRRWLANGRRLGGGRRAVP